MYFGSTDDVSAPDTSAGGETDRSLKDVDGVEVEDDHAGGSEEYRMEEYSREGPANEEEGPIGSEVDSDRRPRWYELLDYVEKKLAVSCYNSPTCRMRYLVFD